MHQIGHLLRQTATVTRATRSIVNGQVIEARAVVSSGVPCRIPSPSRGSLTLYGSAEQVARPRMGYFLPDADIRPDDHLEVDGVHFRVLDAEVQPDRVYLAVSLERLAYPFRDEPAPAPPPGPISITSFPLGGG